MSGFDMGWLALREPVDRLARNQDLFLPLSAYLQSTERPTLMDIGCGTGSTYRSLHDALPDGVQWLLVDHDNHLLEEAKALIGASHVSFLQHDLTDLGSLPFESISVMTASAFFDLCSQDFCSDLCARLEQSHVGLYAALNFDGRITWRETHDLDAKVVDAFNRHQRGDKGFGPALGPAAGSYLADKLSGIGFKIKTADSTWMVAEDRADLHEAFIRGMVQPALEASDLTRNEIEAWLDFRLVALRDGGHLQVGHLDLLALPAAS